LKFRKWEIDGANGELFLNNILKISWLFKLSLGFLAISYLVCIVSQTFLVFRDIWAKKKMFHDPVGFFLDVPMKLAAMDFTGVNMLYKYEPEALKYALVQLKAARAGLEKRTNLLAGAIDKLGIVGMIPGVLAYVKIINTELSSNFPAVWVQTLAYATPIWYLGGLIAHSSMITLDRFIMLIEMVIENKKSETS